MTATSIPGVTLGRMRWWHLDQVLPVEDELFGPWRWSKETYWSELAAPGRWYQVALRDGDVIGWVGLAVQGPDGDVQTIAVSPAAQGLGLGRVLLEALVTEAVKQNVQRVLLEVRADNEPALGLYETAGFRRLGLRPKYYQPGDIDAVIMERAVA